MAGATSKESEVFRKFISTQSILIADESASARSGLFQILAQLGAKPHQIALASSLSAAIGEIEVRKPTLVLAEYDFGRSCGLELLQTVRQNHPDAKKMLFILLTSNTSQTAVARAAEEDVDAYILKPFTPEVFRNSVIKTALMKIHPPEYVRVVEEGKEKLAQGDMDGAEALFRKALALDSKPALAHYYMGQVQYMRKVIDGAQDSYETGLNINRIHYKCLVGLYELLMELKAHGKAYEVVKKLSQYFPANPKRLTEVLRLAIINKQYDDVERYYQIFCNIESRNEVLVNYICAALVVCGKYYLISNNRSRALELMQKAAVTSAGKPKIIREIVLNLLEAKMAAEAAKFLDRFPLDARQTPEYLLLDFQIFSAQQPPGPVVTKGRELLRQGVFDEKFFEIMITKAVEADVTSSAEAFVHDASSKFPGMREFFESLLKPQSGSAKAAAPS